MSPVQRLAIAAVVLLTGAVGYGVGRSFFRPVESVPQPIAFNHQIHVDDLGMDCESCHELVRSSRHAGLPTLSSCLGCHEEPQTDLAEEEKLRTLAAAGEEDVFRKLFQLQDHTFYTHRRHVAIAGIECQVCHGDIAATTRPPERPLVRVDMDFCVRCHEAQAARADCTDCHR